MPKRILIGTVVSDKTDKTVTVKVERKEKHPLYGKIIRRSKKYHAHDEGNEFKPGDVVRIEETRPISKTKTWKVLDRIGAAKAQTVEINDPEALTREAKPSAPVEKGSNKGKAKAEDVAEADA